MNDFGKIPAVLYYYCNINDFFDLTTNKRFLFNDINKSGKFFNAHMLTKIFYKSIHTNKEVLSQIAKNNSTNILNVDLYMLILNQQMVDIEYSIIPLIYGFSLTSNCNKWYEYEKSSADICIGIKTDLFKSDKLSDIIKLNKVNYDITEIKNKTDTIVKSYLENPINQDIRPRDKIQKYIDDDLLLDSLTYKNDYFSDENEYMVILNLFIRELFLDTEKKEEIIEMILNHSWDNDPYSLTKSEFKTINNQLVSYKYFGNKNMLDSIVSVHINPLCDIEKSDIDIILSSKNVNHENIRIEKTQLKLI